MKKSYIHATILGVAVLALLVAPQVEAQTMMPICAYSRTFSSGSLTRGLWFTSPADICIVQLNVPNELNEPVQNAQIFIMPNVPGNFPTLGTQTSVFWAGNQPVSAPIDTGGIDVLAGEHVGLLGACGSTTMRNSYCTNGSKTTTISGNNATYWRFGSQNSIFSAPAPNYWQEPAGPPSRVEMWYTDGPCGGGGGGGGGCTTAQCANLDCSVCSRADQTSVDALETKADQLQTDLDAVAGDVAAVQTTVNMVNTKVDALEVKLDEGGGACEVLELMLPFLPGSPELPSTHPCFSNDGAGVRGR